VGRFRYGLAADPQPPAVMSRRSEDRMIFAIDFSAGLPTVTIGIPPGAWAHIRDGNPCTFDLTGASIPVRVVVIGGEDHDAIQATLNALKPETRQ
jgi:hypothetical protein